MNEIVQNHEDIADTQSRDISMMETTCNTSEHGSTETDLTSSEGGNDSVSFRRQFDTICDMSFQPPRQPSKMTYSSSELDSIGCSTDFTSLEGGNDVAPFMRQFNTMCDRSFRPPRRPEKMTYSISDLASKATDLTSLEDGHDEAPFARQMDTMCDRSFRAPLQPARRRSESSKNMRGLKIIKDMDENEMYKMKVSGESKGEDKEDNHNDYGRYIPSPRTQEMAYNSAPCSSVYCNTSSDNTVSRAALSVLTKDVIRAFLVDYYADYDALKEPQTIDSVTCFAEKYYRPDFVFVRPSGNPASREEVITALHKSMRMIGYHLLSIDSITLLAAQKAAVVTHSCEHFFEYKGIPAEDRATMTTVLELTGGEIKIVHEHRSKGLTLPKESRWKSE